METANWLSLMIAEVSVERNLDLWCCWGWVGLRWHGESGWASCVLAGGLNRLELCRYLMRLKSRGRYIKATL